MNNFAAAYEQYHCWNPQFEFHHISECSLLFCCCCCFCFYCSVCLLFVLAIIVWCLFSLYVHGYKHKLIVVVMLPESWANWVCWLCCLQGTAQSYGGFRTGTHNTWTTLQSPIDNLMHYWTIEFELCLHTFITSQCGLFLCHSVLICYVFWSVWFVCPKLQTWLATCFGRDKKLQPAYSTQERSCSLLSSDISQVGTFPKKKQITTVWILLTKQPATFQTASTFQTGVKLQPAPSRQEPVYSLHSPGPAVCNPPDSSQVTAFIQSHASHSQHPSDESQITACILLTL